MSVYELPKNRVTYNLRYFLPYAPEWGTPEICERRLHELIDFCREASIDAVQFYVNTLPGTYYMPAHNAEEQKHWAAWMGNRVAPALRGIGISYQLNLQALLGHSSYDLDMRDEYDWDFMVNQHGEETLGCPCPLSPYFREIMGDMLRLWASTEPDIIWIDDDFRLHNHGLARQDLDFYCYCDLHLSKFQEHSGSKYSREKLVAEILKPGKPSELRRKWLSFLNQSMAETAAWVRRQVQEVSINTRLAQMISMPDVHAAEGRDWKAFLEALCGDHTPMVRPCSGVYTGTSAPVKEQVTTYSFQAQSTAILEQSLGSGAVEYGPELENTRFTTWAKSASNTKYALILGQLAGNPQITLSINDLDGSPLSEEPTNLPVLRETRPILETLAGMRLCSWRPMGVAFICDPESAYKVHIGPEASMQDLVFVRDWEDVLLQMGIPAKYVTPSDVADSADIIALERYSAWCLSDEELKRVLSGAVLLDAGAAQVLQWRGFGEYLGVHIGSSQTYGIQSEAYHNNSLPGVYACRVPHRGTKWHELTLQEADLVSEFIDPKNRYHVGSTIYENRLGGRVAIYASIGDFAFGTFGSHARLRWLHGLLRWLSKERFCVLAKVPHHGLTIVRSTIGSTLVAFANLGMDILHQVSFRISMPELPDSVVVLDNDGNWKKAACVFGPSEYPGVFQMTVQCNLNTFAWLILMLERSTAGG